MYNIKRLYSVLWGNNKYLRIIGLGNRKGKSILERAIDVQFIIIDKLCCKNMNSKLLKLWLSQRLLYYKINDHRHQHEVTPNHTDLINK
jgi:hypothetical protein